MQQVGHADPKLTLSVYAQVMFRREGERERLQGLVGALIGHYWALALICRPPSPASSSP
jgi:hypothetical protein